MKSFFEGIQYLFVDILFTLLLRSLELESWFAVNTINWLFMIICSSSNGILVLN
jgi:hypothetical protein